MRVDFNETVSHDYNLVSSRDYFYLREKTPEMKNNAVNGVYTCERPFVVPWNDDISKGDYLNVVSFSRGKIYYFEDGNVIFPPSIRFKLVDQKGKTMFWECISQRPKYSLSNSNKNSKMLLYYTAFFIIADVILLLYMMFI